MEMKITGICKRVLIWTEGGSNIGMGHIMRSLPIAHSLREAGFEVSFAVNNEKPAIDAVTSAGFSTIPHSCCFPGMDNVTDFAIVVFDTKSDISGNVQYFKNNGLKIVLIDDRSSAAAGADCVIIPSLSKIETPGAIPHNNILQGIQYFPLNQNFMQARGKGKSPRGSGLRVLVTMGGSDPNNITNKIVKALHDMEEIELRVVVGPSMTVSKEIEEFMDVESLIFHPDVNKMALLMLDADIAFTAFGITLYELAYMGVPSIVIANYQKDKADMAAYAKYEAGIPLGYFDDVTDNDIINSVARFLQNNELMENMILKARMLVDGNGSRRISEIVERLVESKAQVKQY